MEAQELKEKLQEGLMNIQQSLNNTNAEIARLQERGNALRSDLLRQEGAILAINQLIDEPEEEAPEGVS